MTTPLIGSNALVQRPYGLEEPKQSSHRKMVPKSLIPGLLKKWYPSSHSEMRLEHPDSPFPPVTYEQAISIVKRVHPDIDEVCSIISQPSVPPENRFLNSIAVLQKYIGYFISACINVSLDDVVRYHGCGDVVPDVIGYKLSKGKVLVIPTGVALNSLGIAAEGRILVNSQCSELHVGSFFNNRNGIEPIAVLSEYVQSIVPEGSSLVLSTGGFGKYVVSIKRGFAIIRNNPLKVIKGLENVLYRVYYTTFVDITKQNAKLFGPQLNYLESMFKPFLPGSSLDTQIRAVKVLNYGLINHKMYEIASISASHRLKEPIIL